MPQASKLSGKGTVTGQNSGVTFTEAFFFKKLAFLERIFCLIAGVFILIPGQLFMCMSLGIILLLIYSLFIQNFKKN